MRILALSDIHQKTEILKALLEKVDKSSIELILVAGDITNYGDATDASRAIEMLSFAKVLAVPGNLDTKDVVAYLKKENKLLHRKCIEFKGITFCGFGGGLIGSVGECLYSELEIEEHLRKIIRPNCVLVTHLPPKDTKLDLSEGEHIGSNAVRKIILEKKPLLSICGHAHGAYGKIALGSTTCINVAAVKEGRAAIIEIKDGKVTTQRLSA